MLSFAYGNKSLNQEKKILAAITYRLSQIKNGILIEGSSIWAKFNEASKKLKKRKEEIQKENKKEKFGKNWRLSKLKGKIIRFA